MPSDRAQYIHRLGRTARAGKSGSGVLILADFERRFLNQLKDLPITERPRTLESELDAVSTTHTRLAPSPD